MTPEEVAARLLELAASEGSLAPERLEDAARGLRERAERLVEERIAPLEAKLGEQARELAWRSELQQALEKELRWHRDNEAASAAELDRARGDRDAASGAHDRLLEHHRRVARSMAERLEAVEAGLPRRAAQARTALRAVIAALRAEAGE